MSRRTLMGTAGRVAPWQIVNRASTALLPILLATWFGRSRATDLFNLTWALFVLAGSLVFGCFQDSALVPIVVEVERREPALLPRLAGALVRYTVVIATVLAALIGTGVWLWFRTRVPEELGPLVVLMALGFSLQLPLLALRSLSGSLLAARFSFIPDALAGALGVTVTLAIAASARRVGLGVVPFAMAGGELVAVVVLFRALRSTGLRLAPTWERPQALLRFLRLASSEIGGAAVVRVNPLVDQLVAQTLGVVGGGTILRLSGDLAGFPAAILGSTFLSVLLSHLATARSDGHHRRFRRTVVQSAVVVGGVLTLMAGTLAIVRVPLTMLVYGRGAMDHGGLLRLAHILPYHLVGLPAFGVLLVLARAHVALGNSRILVGMGILSATSNLVLNLVLAPLLGLEGIALGTSLVNVLAAVVFARLLAVRLRAADLQGSGSGS